MPRRPTPPSALALRQALRPGRRPNPPEGRFRLERRHGAGGDWFEVESFGTSEAALDEVLGPTFSLDHGDLVRLLRPDGTTQAVWVEVRGQLAYAGTLTPGLIGDPFDWVEAWEGPEPGAYDLLRAAAPVHPHRLITAAADCAERGLCWARPASAPERDGTGAASLAVLRRWLRGEATDAAVSDAADEAYDAGEYGIAYACNAAVRLAQNAGAQAVADEAAEAAADAESAPGVDPSADEPTRREERRALSNLVRAHIPLSVLLLARAGEPTPPDLVL